ncbi:MAG: fibronectin type III domain-containing protein, partial [Parcubacteria group bacterium]
MRNALKCIHVSLFFLVISCSLLGNAPAEPTEVATIAGNKQITIQWKAVEGASSYNIYWSPVEGGALNKRNQIKGVSSPYSHGGLTKATMYYYVVTAVNFFGESRASQEVAGSLLGVASSEPTEVAMIAGNKQITIQWKAVEGASSYNIYWSPVEGGALNKRNQI